MLFKVLIYLFESAQLLHHGQLSLEPLFGTTGDMKETHVLQICDITLM